ncbi:hypothetical protein [Kluyvera intermedia]|uniref:outer membrane lipoprotein n=1 Tax=Kluyvera intermedia TaxID=61648 RepID=UPI0035237422
MNLIVYGKKFRLSGNPKERGQFTVKKILFIAIGLMSLPALAGTQTQIEYGVVQDSHIVTTQSQSHPLRTVAAGAAGAAVGNQFGGGTGKSVMTAAGAIAGAETSRQRQGNRQSSQQVDLTVKTDGGKLIEVVQDYNSSLSFTKGDKVRILTSGSNTVVDKSV